MPRRVVLLVAAALLGLSAVAVPALAASPHSPTAVVAATPPIPQHDAFYRAPAGWRGAPLGTILRHRPVTLAAFATLPQHIQSWQLMFRSTSTAGKPIVAVTTVMLPANARPKALLSYQIAEDAAAPQCAPSYELRLAGPQTALVNDAELLIIDAAVGDGFAVSVPDHEGVPGNFGAAKQPGYIIFDGLRAAEHFAPLHLPGAKTRVGVWGYSGGSLASGWAAQVQHRYAPQVHVDGIAVGGFATDIPGALLKINGGPASGLIASVLPGVMRGAPGLAALLRPEMTAAGKALLAHAATQCEVENVAQYPFVNFDRYLKHPIKSLLARPAFRKQMDRLNWLSAHTMDRARQHGCATTTVPTMAISAATLSTLPVVVQSILLALAGLPVG